MSCLRIYIVSTIFAVILFGSTLIMLKQNTSANNFATEWHEFYDNHQLMCELVGSDEIHRFNDFQNIGYIISFLVDNRRVEIISDIFPTQYNQTCFLARDNSTIWLGSEPKSSDATPEKRVLVTMITLAAILILVCGSLMIRGLIRERNAIRNRRLLEQTETYMYL